MRGARWLLASLLLLAWLDPPLPGAQAPLDLIALVDVSESVAPEAREAAWQRLASQASTLPPAGRLTVVHFAAEARVASAPVALAAAGAVPLEPIPALPATGTDLAGALEAAIDGLRPGRDAALVLLSDGRPTRPGSETGLRRLAAGGVRVVALPTDVARPADDGWIAQLSAPARIHAGERLLARLELGAGGRHTGVLRVRLDGEEQARTSVVLESGAPTRLSVELPPLAAGLHRLSATLEVAGDPRPGNDARGTLVEASGAPRILYLTGAGPAPPLFAGLVAGGRDVQRIAPDALSEKTPVPALYVLDDVARDDAPEAIWRLLARRVRQDAAGLLVLAGPRSFGAGGYRGSTLETLLPVRVEGRGPGRRSAVLFLVDSSGSMEEDRSGRGRLALARRAVLETLPTLGPDDAVGVTSFALEPRELLPLAVHPDAAEKLAARFPGASGGTRLGPALDHAVAQLGSLAAERRVLVLITDGFVEEDLAASIRRLRSADVRLVALAVGSDVDLRALRQLVGSDGTLLRVDEVAELPRLARQRVAERVAPVARGPILPRPGDGLPFGFEPRGWPPLDACAVTRARPAAAVHALSPDGLPIFASHAQGNGRVAVLTGGLGPWAGRWRAWPALDELTSGLLGWLARPAEDPRLHLAFEETDRGALLQIEALGEDGDWSRAAHASLRVTDPSGASREIELRPEAPGRFVHALSTPRAGAYRVAARVDDRRRVSPVLVSGARELDPTRPSRLAEWQRAGLLELWTEAAAPAALLPARSAWHPRRALLWLGLVGFAALLVLEFGRVDAWTAARLFSRPAHGAGRSA